MSITSPELIIFDKKLTEERDYWIEQLSREIGTSNLRLYYERPEGYSRKEDTVEIKLPESVYQKLVTLTGNSSFLIYTTLLAALKVCLYHYTGSETIVVGSPALKEVGQARALPIVDDICAQMPFRQFLLQVRETLIEAYARQNYPFNRLVKDLGLQSQENRCPLFDIALLLEDFHADLAEIRNDITIRFAQEKEELTGRIEFSDRLFRKDSIEQFRDHFVNLLNQALENTSTLLCDLKMFTEAECHKLLVEWNDTRAAYPQDRCIHQLFEAQAAQTPDVVAVIFSPAHPEQAGAGQLTYGELNRRANQLAHHLQARGVGPEVLVGVYMERSLEMVTGILGILKAGGAYVPFDPAYPLDRLAFIRKDAQVKVMLTQQQFLDSGIFEPGIHPICLDSDSDLMAQESEENLVNQAVPANLAYAIYTSGSTGQPKGALIPHQALVNYTLDAIKQFGWQPGERFLQFAPLSFDVSVEEIFPTWISGATLVIPDESRLTFCLDLHQMIEQETVTAMELPTAYWHEWIYQLLLTNQHPPTCLRFVIICGEKVLPKRLAVWQQSGVSLIHVYGLTEATVTSTIHKHVADPERRILAELPVGRPLANTEIYLLDSRLEPVPVGVPGEIYLGSDSLARCYLNRPKITAERFVPNPFSQKPGVWFYKTGDLACYLPDGNLEFLGRVDRQVKIRGYRIELGEIEATLSRHPAVRETVVLIREIDSTPGDKRLIAYVVPNVGSMLSAQQLRNFLMQQLPTYMVPSAFVLLEALPLNANGKIDRRALPSPNQTRPDDLDTFFVSPRTPTEEQLVDIWIEVLGVTEVGVYDDFFALGGHSLLATQVVTRMREAFQIDLPLRSLFETSTVAGLSEYIETIRWAKQGLEVLPCLTQEEYEEEEL